MNTNNTLSQLSEVATRIKELREIMGFSTKEMSEKTDVDETKYLTYESGTVDIPFSFIHKCALVFGVEMTELLEGSSAKLSTYTVTRKGQGQETAKEDGIDIANLAPKFKDKLAEPYYVTYEYSASQLNKPIHLATHSGQEFDLILSGQLKVQVGDHTEILSEGDSIFYNSSIPHGMIAIGGKSCTFVAVVMSPCSLFLASHREVADTLHITDDTCQIINVFAMTFRTLLEVVLADMTALVADRIRDVEYEVVASFLSCNSQKLGVLSLREVLLEIEVESRTSCEVLDVFAAVQTHLVNDIERLVLHDVEVAVVAVAWHNIAVFPIPLCVLYTYIFGRDHLAVEEGCLCAVLLVVFLDKSECVLYELHILRVVVDLDSKELGSLYQTVDTDCEVLTTDVDESCVKERKHSLCLKGLEVFVICELNLMHKIHNLSKICKVVAAVLYRVLDTAVKVDGKHALRTCGHSAGTEGVAESVVLDLVAQTAAGCERIGIVAHICEE